MSDAPWHGYFINLERSQDRRASIEAGLARCGISGRYQRFEAVDGHSARSHTPTNMLPGAWGCLVSHTAVISLAHRRDRYLHVLEDDATLSRHFVPLMERLIASGALRPFDLVFTDVAPLPNDAVTIVNLKTAYDAATAGAELQFRLLDLRRFQFVGTTSYFVNPESLDKVEGLLRHTTPPLPVDTLYLKMIHSGDLRAACVFPFATATDPRLVSIINGEQTLLAAAFDAVRYAFYADADIAAAMPMFGFPPRLRTHDARLDLLSEVFRAVT
jgi:GR25 family glycosyltransferase involved in LPS biosynthesis